ncbi:MAG: hypothetical protein N2C14_07285 [Planctomycetales bacterium]
MSQSSTARSKRNLAICAAAVLLGLGFHIVLTPIYLKDLLRWIAEDVLSKL